MSEKPFPWRVTDVRALPGDSAFLLDNGRITILCDTGYAFTGARVAENIRRTLGDRVKSNMIYKLCKHMVYKFKSA